MLGVSLFPSQVLSDLNFFNVSSKEELASRLRAVQRVSAAAIGAYLMVRYEPILMAKLGSSCATNVGVCLAFFTGYVCLSFPACILAYSGGDGYLNTMRALSSIRNKEIGWAVIDVAMVACYYFISQIYKKNAEIGPNLLEKLFQKVEDRYAQPLWDRYYK